MVLSPPAIPKGPDHFFVYRAVDELIDGVDTGAGARSLILDTRLRCAITISAVLGSSLSGAWSRWTSR